MPRNEDGEYELILANRQLVSIFVIVVVLLGIFFAMGYIVGRNSGASALASNKAPEAGKPVMVAPETPAGGPEMTKTSAAGGVVPEPGPAESMEAAPAATKPAASEGETVKEKAAEAARPVRQAAAPAATGGLEEPAAGETYLQVVATTMEDARNVAGTLNRNQLPSRLAAGPNNLVRVLVGPAKDAAELARLRSALEGKGFHPIVRKY